MRAKTLYESISFERGGDSKEILGVGGKEYQNVRQQILDDANKKYTEFLKKFIGKTITAKMLKENTGRNYKNYTIIIKEIGYYNIDDEEVIFIDIKDQEYSIQIDDKIYIPYAKSY